MKERGDRERLEGGANLVTMDNLYVLTNKDVAEDGKRDKEGGEGALVVERKVGDVVHLQAIGHIPHPLPVAIPVGNYNYLLFVRIYHST